MKEITEVVTNYFKGYLSAQSDVLSKAFHRDARLFTVSESGLDRTELGSWLKNLDERLKKGDKREAEVEILNIDVTNDAAVVKAKLKFSKFTFIDYLSLLQIDHQWKIINKIYTTEVNQEVAK